MAWWEVVLLGLGMLVAIWAVAVLMLLALGRRQHARALARFIPDCITLFARLLADPRVPRRRKLVLLLAVGYLGLPLDLIPDFIPVVGQLDDALVVAFALRFVLRGGDNGLVRELWPGPAESLAVIERLSSQY